jgi:hypothetical protein
MRIYGAIEKKDCQQIIGWLTIMPGETSPAVIEILVDGKAIGTAVAREPRPDVKAAGFGDGLCGFHFNLPPELAEARSATIEMRLQATEIYLTHSARAGDSKAPKCLAGTGSVFVFGPARSGTSVMFLALRKVLDLSGLGESHVPQIFQRLLFQFYEYVAKFASREGVLAGRLPVDALEERLIAFLRQFYFDQYGGGPFVDKTPGLEALVGAPFLKKAFPGAKIIVMERDGIEVIESYRRKFAASFEDALKEWSSCAVEIAKLKIEMPEILFVSQNELRKNPDAVARTLAERLGRTDRAEDLAQFFRSSREDVLADKQAWEQGLTLERVNWTDEEKQAYSLSNPPR